MQLENADDPIVVTPSPILTVVNAVQLENADVPIVVTLSGMVIDVKLLQQ